MIEETSIADLSNRLARIERRCRRQRAGLAIVLLFAGTGLVMGQGGGRPDRLPELIEAPGAPTPIEERIVAREFVLVDADGVQRASLVTDRAGSAFFVLFDSDSNPRASVSVIGNMGPALTLYDAGGETRAVVGATNRVASHVETAAGNVERYPASSIILLDDAGDLLWRTP